MTLKAALLKVSWASRMWGILMPCQRDSGLTWEEAHSCGASPSGLPEHNPRWFFSGEHPASDRHHQSEVIACSTLCACKPA